MVVHYAPHKESTYNLKLDGLSVLLNPAYVDSCLSIEFGPTDPIRESQASPYKKIQVDQVQAVTPAAEPSDDLCNSGKILKASAVLQHLPFPSAQPQSEYGHSVPAGQSKEKNCRKRRTKRHATLLIATQLSELQSEDPDKIIIVRKINRLGFDSAEILKKHFTQFGLVEKVRLSNSHTKEPGKSFQIRLRPSGIGFVVFENAEAAAKVLMQGETHMINGAEVRVRGFERRRCDSSSSVGGDEAIRDEADETSSIATACAIAEAVALSVMSDDGKEDRGERRWTA
jgi:hypothetical protein